jgi:ligand-binding SRPBCC domain-containing protein
VAHRRVDREGRGRERLTAWRFELASLLAAAPEDVWARVGTIDGVNLELAPWLRMTAPRDARRLEDLPLGREAFRSWLLLLGLVPVEVDRVCLVAVEALHGFHERSRLVTQRSWSHERTLERRPEGTLVVDRVEAVPRWPLAARWQRRMFLAVFRHRHRRLRAAFGAG